MKMILPTSATARFFVPLLVGAAACAALAQAEFGEDFEGIGSVPPGQQGPSGLIAEGWIFRNQSSPLGGAPAFSANGGSGWPYEGNGYLRSTSSSAGFVGATLSNWAILPEIPGLQSGDIFSVWALDGNFPSLDTFLEIRYSPGGGTGTGSGPEDVGDFTDVLFSDELPVSEGPVVYTLVQSVVPGPGRIAIRFYAPNIHGVGGASANLYLDSLTVGAAPDRPCGLVLPDANETVIWDTAGGPYTICQDLRIPAGATLQLDPGVVVLVEPSRSLFVEGALIAAGADSDPVLISGDNVSGLVVTGSLALRHTQIDCNVQLDGGGEAMIADSLLQENAWLGATSADTALFMDRCAVQSRVFSGAGASHLNDVDFTNPATSAKLGRIAKVGSVTSVVPIEYVLNCQTRLIENVTITGVAGPAITVGAGQTGTADVLLDESNTLTGNEYPIWIRVGGLHPDSVIPVGTNVHDAVLAPFALGSASDLRSLATIPDLGVPYHVGNDATFNGRVDIPPGCRFLLAPGVSLNFRQNNGYHPIVRGLPELPIRFERLNPAGAWATLSSTQGVNLWEHLAIDGAGRGVSASQSDIELRDCVVTNCEIGVKPSGQGIVYGSGNVFTGNEVAVENDTSAPVWGSFSGIKFDGSERPNSFDGNTLAANNVPAPLGNYADDMHMEHNWWGAATGPYASLSNPDGEGDPVSHGVLFDPWEVAPPDLANERPVIRLVTQLHPVALTGEKLFLEWEASDDEHITGFDIEVRTPPTFTDPPGWRALATDLDPSTRRFELLVPDREHGMPKQVQFRILAYDAAGQAGVEYFWLNIPDEHPGGTVEFLSDLTQPFLYDGQFTMCYTALGLVASPMLYIELDGDLRTMLEFGISPGENRCVSGRMPMASTDTARFAIRAQGNTNDDYWYFSDYFEIRPDTRFQDTPPTVSITSPAGGAAFRGGSLVPIEWSAADDDFVREYRIQASYNGGYTYHTVADHIPGDASGYQWRLPQSSGIADVRLRVVAIDKRFQNSSATVSIDVTPGRVPVKRAPGTPGAVEPRSIRR